MHRHRQLASNLLLIALSGLVLGGCIMGSARAPRPSGPVSTDSLRDMEFGERDSVTRQRYKELDELTNAFADRYRMLLEDALMDIVRENKEPAERAAIYRLVAETSTSAYDIATTDDPFTQVLDLTILATLTSQVWIDGNLAEKTFGSVDGERLVRALRTAREEIWEIAGKFLRADELSALDFMIAAWRRKNPEVQNVSFVRFSDFAAQRGQQSVLSDTATGFEAVDQALWQLESYERLVERMFYLAKRGPTIVNWQTQAAMEEVLARDETQRTLKNLDEVTTSVHNLSETVDTLANDVPKLISSEREAVFAEIDRRQKDVDAALEQVKTIAADARAATEQVKATLDGTGPLLADVQRTASSLQPTLEAVQKLAETSDRIVARVAEIKGPPVEPDPNAPPPKPFDIAEYQETLRQATITLESANELLSKGDSLSRSPALRETIDEFTRATEERIRSVESALDRLIWKAGMAAAAVVGIMLAAAVAYRFVSVRIAGGAK
jgi:uncharacterized protein YoxC